MQYIAGPLPPQMQLVSLGENSPVGPDLFRSDYRLDIQTTSEFSLYVQAQGSDITRMGKFDPCMQVLEIHDGSEGDQQEGGTDLKSCTVRVKSVTSGSYHIIVFTTKSEKVNITYEAN